MRDPFSVLEDLQLGSRDLNDSPVLPSTFLGGSTPRLSKAPVALVCILHSVAKPIHPGLRALATPCHSIDIGPQCSTLLSDQEISILTKLLKLKGSSSMACAAREPKLRGTSLFGM
jgi:hypothetical protein